LVGEIKMQISFAFKGRKQGRMETVPIIPVALLSSGIDGLISCLWEEIHLPWLSATPIYISKL